MTTTPPSWPALDAQLLADAAATYNWRLGLPVPLAVTPDGAVLFRRTGPRSFAADLFELDTKTGAVKTLFSVGGGDEKLSDAEKARRERTRTATRGVVGIDVSADGKTVFVPIGSTWLLLDRQSGAQRELDPGGDAYDPHLSPDATHVAFVRGGDLWLLPVTGGHARKLTQHDDGFEIGIADFAAQEELGRTRGWWWSPDSKQIVFQRSDNRPIDTLYVADARHNERPPVPFKYPRAGRPNAIVDLGIVAIAGGEPRWITWDHATYEYLARVSWGDRGPLTIVVLSREQTDLALYAVENDALRPLVTEHDDAWINVPSPRGGIGYRPGTPLWLDDGSFLWMTESDGHGWTIEHRNADGSKRNRYSTLPALRELVGVKDGKAIIVTDGRDPLRSEVRWLPLDPGVGPGTTLVADDGVTTADYQNGVLVTSTALDTANARKEPRSKKLVVHVGDKTFELPSVAEAPRLEPTTVFETVTLEDRTHYVAITRPRSFDKTQKYPVLLKVYGGPHAQYVDAARDTYVMDQFYADAGFIVVRSDNRGTPYRGRTWERAILKDLITIPLNDQIGALQATAANHPEMDMTRVGVTGWSFGGYFATMAVLLRPDVFHAGVAGAPVTDWQLYDTAYTERYMRTPEHNADGYKQTSALTHAAKLTRPLLIIHGITDDNVHFAHALALIEELYVAHKRAEVITLSATHMVPDPKLSLAREQVQIDFFREHLAPK